MLLVDSIQVYLEEDIPDDFQSVLVVLFKESELVMVKNKRRGWEFPGGHKEGEELYFETAKREAFEEAGAELNKINYLGYYVLPGGHVTIITYAQVAKFQNLQEEFETEKVDIFKELPEDLSFKDGLYESILKHLKRKGEI